MNKVLLYLRRSMIPVVAVVSSGVLFSACLKDKDYNNPDIPAAGLTSFNLAPDQSGLVIRLSGNSLTQSPLTYTGYTYNNLYVGNRNIESFSYNSNSQLTSTNYNFEQDKYYSLFVIGNNGAYRNVVSVDNFDSLSASSGKAYVRYVNAITDSVNTPTVTIAASGSNVVNENAAYGGVGAFTAVTAGSITVAVKNNNGVDANRNITVEQKKAYTILLVGVPGATDENKKVQIRYISSGTLTDSTANQ
jgi:hypothetical protein